MKDKKSYLSGMAVGGLIVLAICRLVAIVEIIVLIFSMAGISSAMGSYGFNNVYTDGDGNIYYYNGQYFYDTDGNYYSPDELDIQGLGQGSSAIDTKTQAILNLIDKSFLFDYDKQALTDYMYTGLVAGLNDPYAAYYSAEYIRAQQEDDDVVYCGIGAQVSINPDTLEKSITYVYLNSPAMKAGILAGDIIMTVDGVNVSNYDLDSTVALVRGEEGTTVVLGIIRDGVLMEISIVRAPIEADSVYYEMMEENVGYIELVQFTSTSYDEVKTALDDLQSQGMEKLVFDLRDNPGGLLTAVCDICDLFLDKGLLITYEKEKNGTTYEYKSEHAATCTVPMAILVNGDSASASELMSGALQAHGRATIVGTQTFGKGIVQNTYSLSDGSAIKFTVAYYYLPSDVCIHGTGVTPDVVIEYDENAEYDNQYEKAIEVLTR